MSKTKVTRTFGPIHFEDLDAHRFEDLIRELIYDYKDWQTIEATGRSGNDAGFDIRAYEKIAQSFQEDEGDNEEIHPMDGNLWMIQCKREKEIGSKKIKKILSDISPENLPYGYILAASANFSKDSYDTFREELRKKGVMEFYLWGRAELEDLLHLPKNDRILFTFFGISLVSRRKSRATEIRQVVSNKNKLYRILGETPNLHQRVLLRDSKDTKYPYQTDYTDFKDRPRWREYDVVEYHSWGLIVCIREHFAFFDSEMGEYDYTEAVDLIYRDGDSKGVKDKQQEKREKIEDFWDHLPRRNQAKLIRNGLIRFDEMIVIDEKGDDLFHFPHIFVDFKVQSGPFSGTLSFLRMENRDVLLDDFKHVRKFPISFPQPQNGTIHEGKGITLDSRQFNILKNSLFIVLYDTDGKYNFLKQRDVAPIENKDGGYLHIMHVENTKVSDYLKHNGHLEWDMEQQIGRKLDPNEMINIYECKKTFAV